MQSRRFLIIGGALAAVIAVIVVGRLIFSGGDPYNATCQKFISYIVKQDANKSYALFSPTVKSNTTSAAWKEEVLSLQSVYYNGTAQLTSTTDTTPNVNGKPSKNKQKELSYTLTGPANSLPIHCTVVHSGGYLVSGYSTGASTSNNASSAGQKQ